MTEVSAKVNAKVGPPTRSVSGKVRVSTFPGMLEIYDKRGCGGGARKIDEGLKSREFERYSGML